MARSRFKEVGRLLEPDAVGESLRAAGRITALDLRTKQVVRIKQFECESHDGRDGAESDVALMPGEANANHLLALMHPARHDTARLRPACHRAPRDGAKCQRAQRDLAECDDPECDPAADPIHRLTASAYALSAFSRIGRAPKVESIRRGSL